MVKQSVFNEYSMSTLQFTHQQKKVSMRKCSTKFLKPRNGYAGYLRKACHELVNNKKVQLDANPLLKKILDIKELDIKEVQV